MARFAAAPALNPQEWPLNTATVNFRRAAAHLNLSPDLQTLLSTPLRELKVEIPLRLGDGSLQVFTGYRVQHNGVRGPVSGGFRFDPASDLEQMHALAASNTWKAAVLNVPFGGAQGAIACDPRQLSRTELERLTRKFVARIHQDLGPYRDVPCPDVNTDPEVMGWILDQYSTVHGYTPACAAGKPHSMGGSRNSDKAAGKGVALLLLQTISEMGMNANGLRIALQGFGCVGRAAAEELQRNGCVIVAVCDSRGAVQDRDGLDIAALTNDVTSTGSVVGFAGVEKISHDTLLQSDCDVLILAATDSVLTAGNAARTRAKLVVEAANLAVTPSADAIFEKLGTVVLPDILASAGGMASAYFEWTQNVQQFFWQEEEVERELSKTLQQAYATVVARARKENISLRTAAYCIGMERVAHSENLRAA